jgi:biopolymer transport protein ExbD
VEKDGSLRIADGALPYEEVMRMMALMQQAGVAKVGLMAQPEAKAN